MLTTRSCARPAPDRFRSNTPARLARPHWPRWTSPTTLGSSEGRPVRRPAFCEAFAYSRPGLGLGHAAASSRPKTRSYGKSRIPAGIVGIRVILSAKRQAAAVRCATAGEFRAGHQGAWPPAQSWATLSHARSLSWRGPQIGVRRGGGGSDEPIERSDKRHRVTRCIEASAHGNPCGQICSGLAHEPKDLNCAGLR
jgi:hypothetical protein